MPLYVGSLFDLIFLEPSVWEALLRTFQSCLSTVRDGADNTQEKCSRCAPLIEAGAAHRVTSSRRNVWNLMNFSTLGKLIFQNYVILKEHLYQSVLRPTAPLITISCQCEWCLLPSSHPILSNFSALYSEIFNLNATCCAVCLCVSVCASGIFCSGKSRRFTARRW